MVSGLSGALAFGGIGLGGAGASVREASTPWSSHSPTATTSPSTTTTHMTTTTTRPGTTTTTRGSSGGGGSGGGTSATTTTTLDPNAEAACTATTKRKVKAKRKGKNRRKKKGKAKVKVSIKVKVQADEDLITSISGKVRGKAAKGKLSNETGQLAAGQTKTFTLRKNLKSKRRGSATANVSVKCTNTAGNVKTTALKVKLKIK